MAVSKLSGVTAGSETEPCCCCECPYGPEEGPATINVSWPDGGYSETWNQTGDCSWQGAITAECDPGSPPSTPAAADAFWSVDGNTDPYCNFVINMLLWEVIPVEEVDTCFEVGDYWFKSDGINSIFGTYENAYFSGVLTISA